MSLDTHPLSPPLLAIPDCGTVARTVRVELSGSRTAPVAGRDHPCRLKPPAQTIDGLTEPWHPCPTERNPPCPSPTASSMSVTEIPRIRHQLIFETFASLDAGTAFVLVNVRSQTCACQPSAAENAGSIWTTSEVQGSGGCG